MNALQHLAPVTVTDQIATYGVLAIALLVLVIAAIAWGPDLWREIRSWFPRETMPPTPTYRIRIARAWDRSAAKGLTPPTVVSIADARERKRLGLIVSPFSEARRVRW